MAAGTSELSLATGPAEFRFSAGALWTDSRGGRCGAVGDLSADEAAAVIACLLRGEHPQAPQVPWAVCRVDSDGSTMASCSPMFHSGLFWQRSERGLVLASDPGLVLSHRLQVQALDEAVIIDHLAMRQPSNRTPFVGLHRLEPGIAMSWRTGTVSSWQWLGPQAWADTWREGPEVPDQYRRIFDEVVDDCVPAQGPLVLLLSGGLDSTFLAASLVRHATVDRTIVGLIHRPARASTPRPDAGWENDEWAFAEELAAMYPGKFVLEPLRNDAATCALDAALDKSRLGWLPQRNPANTVWITAANKRAIALGADRVFTGATGNFTFSSPHGYALGYFLRSGQLREAHQLLAQTAARVGWVRALRGATLRMSAALRHRDDGTRDYAALFDMRLDVVGYTRPSNTREDFLLSMADLGISNMGAANPASQQGILHLDPFESPRLLEFAAQMTPREWMKGPGPRGYARMLAAGRVPDSIRLRRTRGGQSRDAWWVAQHHREQYLQVARELPDIAVLRDVIDHRALLARLQAWDWRDAYGPPDVERVAVERLLHTAQYVQWVTGELQRLNSRPCTTLASAKGSSGQPG